MSCREHTGPPSSTFIKGWTLVRVRGIAHQTSLLRFRGWCRLGWNGRWLGRYLTLWAGRSNWTGCAWSSGVAFSALWAGGASIAPWTGITFFALLSNVAFVTLLALVAF
jgi:hypothetical protein